MNEWFEKMVKEKRIMFFEKNVDDYKKRLKAELLPN